MRITTVICGFVLLWASAVSRAQQHEPGQPAQLPGGFDAAAVARGKELHVRQCGFCHGTNARGGASGPDLTRSAMVQEDEGGKQLGEFLKVGRPDRGMPPFPNLTEAQNADLAAFYHSEIFMAANRFLYKVGDVLVGDAKAGEAFFGGAGKCTACHSATGDLKGVGGKYDPPTLQVRMLNPRLPVGRRGPGGPGGPGRVGSAPPPNLVQATVTLPGGGKVTGILLRLTDFDVTIYEPATGERRSWLRKDGAPAVTVTDPLQAHVDLWSRLTDEQMHDLTAYLASLK